MKYVIFIICILFLIGCSTQSGESSGESGTSTITIVNEKIVSGEFKCIQIYPNSTISKSSSLRNSMLKVPISTKRDKDIDFQNGIIYDENSFLADGIIHTLDLSALLNNKAGEVFLYCEWLDGADDEGFNCYFKPNGLDVEYKQILCGNGIKKQLINMVTDADGKIQWYHNYSKPFDGRIPESDPDYHDYNAISFRIMIYYYDNSGSIND